MNGPSTGRGSASCVSASHVREQHGRRLCGSGGHLTIDRENLGSATCECYQTVTDPLRAVTCRSQTIPGCVRRKFPASSQNSASRANSSQIGRLRSLQRERKCLARTLLCWRVKNLGLLQKRSGERSRRMQRPRRQRATLGHRVFGSGTRARTLGAVRPSLRGRAAIVCLPCPTRQYQQRRRPKCHSHDTRSGRRRESFYPSRLSRLRPNGAPVGRPSVMRSAKTMSRMCRVTWLRRAVPNLRLWTNPSGRRPGPAHPLTAIV